MLEDASLLEYASLFDSPPSLPLRERFGADDVKASMLGQSAGETTRAQPDACISQMPARLSERLGGVSCHSCHSLMHAVK